MLHDDETIDDLQLSGLKIIQKKKGFKFGLDAVLLADFAKLKKQALVCDLGTGRGIIPLLLHAHYEPRHIDAVELQADYADMAMRSVELNGLEDIISVHHADLNDSDKLFTAHSFDAVVSNPPYKKVSSGLRSVHSDIAMAREEIHATIDDVARAASYVLCDHGRLFVVHRPERLCDIIVSFGKCNLAVKRIRFVHSRTDAAPVLVLIEALKNGRDGVFISPPLVVCDSAGHESDELRRIYRREGETL